MRRQPNHQQWVGKRFFVEPTVFSNVTSNMKIVQDEIFGPVVVIQTFKDEKSY